MVNKSKKKQQHQPLQRKGKKKKFTQKEMVKHLTYPAIKRLTLRSGSKFSRKEVLDDIRELVDEFLSVLVPRACLFTEVRCKDTVTPEDLKQALGVGNFKWYSGEED